MPSVPPPDDPEGPRKPIPFPRIDSAFPTDFPDSNLVDRQLDDYLAEQQVHRMRRELEALARLTRDSAAKRLLTRIIDKQVIAIEQWVVDHRGIGASQFWEWWGAGGKPVPGKVSKRWHIKITRIIEAQAKKLGVNSE